MSSVLIIGGGITGLACAKFSKLPYKLFEREATLGGLCRSVQRDGFTFDYSGHFIHLRNPYIKKLLSNMLGSNFTQIKRNSAIYTHKSWVPFPFQANLYYLPEDIKNECVKEFLRKPLLKKTKEFPDLLSWSVATFGRGITKYFMQPYNEKLWMVKANKLSTQWVAPFVPNPSKDEIIQSASTPRSKDFGYNVHFNYPQKGGCQYLIDCFSKKLENISTDISVKTVDLKAKTITDSNGKVHSYKYLISTQPLPELLKSIRGSCERKAKDLSGKLKWNSVMCVNIGIKRNKPNKPFANAYHWVYFPENKYPFYRVGVYSNVTKNCAPNGCAAIYVELSRKPKTKVNKPKILKEIIAGLIDAGITTASDKIETLNFLDMPYAYVTYDWQRPVLLKKINELLNKNSVYSIGRYGAWKYSFVEESISDAKALMESLA